MGGGLLTRAETVPSPSAAESPLVDDGCGGDHGTFFCGSGDGGGDYPGAEVATLKAEEELWEARQASERRRGGSGGSFDEHKVSSPVALFPSRMCIHDAVCVYEHTGGLSCPPVFTVETRCPRRRRLPLAACFVHRGERWNGVGVGSAKGFDS